MLQVIPQSSQHLRTRLERERPPSESGVAEVSERMDELDRVDGTVLREQSRCMVHDALNRVGIY